MCACTGRVLDVGSRDGGSGSGSSASGGVGAGIQGGSGFLSLETDTASSGASAYLASAYFDHGVRDEPGSGACGFQTAGGCRFDPCPPSSPRLRSGVSGAKAPHPDVVTMRGGSLPPLVFAPQDDGSFADQKGAGKGWGAGASITFEWAASAAGGDGFASSDAALRAPAYVTLDPASVLAKPITSLPTTSDLSLSWSTDAAPAAGDQVELTLAFEAPTTGLLRCPFDTSALHGTISSDAFLPVPHGALVHYELRSIHRLTGTASDWHLEYLLSSGVRRADGFVEGSATRE